MSKFTNSPLVSYTRISPNKNSPRTEDKITKIIVHHMAGVGSVESFGEIVASPARQMSANYAIGNDGRIGLYCEEKTVAGVLLPDGQTIVVSRLKYPIPDWASRGLFPRRHGNPW